MRNRKVQPKDANSGGERQDGTSIRIELEPFTEQDFVDEIFSHWSKTRSLHRLNQIFFRAIRIAQYYNELEDKLRAEPVNLTLNEFRILMALVRSGKNGSLTPSELKKSLLVSFGAISKQLERLEAKGYIERKMDAADRRSINVCLTPAGAEMITTITSKAEDPSRIIEDLPEEEQLALEHLLRKVLVTMERRLDEFLKQGQP